MSTAPYQVDVSGTDDETFTFSMPFEMSDGSYFPFAEYEIEYAVKDQFAATQANGGVVIAEPQVTFKKPTGGSLSQGVYQHGCRIKRLATGDYIQVFDGTVTIGEGNFA